MIVAEAAESAGRVRIRGASHALSSGVHGAREGISTMQSDTPRPGDDPLPPIGDPPPDPAPPDGDPPTEPPAPQPPGPINVS